MAVRSAKKKRNMGVEKLQDLWNKESYEYKAGGKNEIHYNRFECKCGKYARYVAKKGDTLCCEDCFIHGHSGDNS